MMRGAERWLAGYLASLVRRPRRVKGLRHLFFCVADHFEPRRGGIGAEEAREGVREWVAAYRRLAARFWDADGRPPCHTWFYPAEEYDADCLEALRAPGAARLGEVEVHLHHRHDTAEGLRATLEVFRDRLHGEHGWLGRDAAGAVRYGFVHGNWALCNSRPDGDWCGVDGEIPILRATGCYADFTFPSAPSATQPRLVNAMYRATDCPGRPRSHDRGELVRVGATGGRDRLDRLLLLQGPLALNFRRRKWGVLPRLENAEISGVNPLTPDRLDLMVRQGIGVAGRPDWVFVKVHTHGCHPPNREAVLGESMWRAHAWLGDHYNNGRSWALHYVSAREAANLVTAAEDGMAGAPAALRDHGVAPPPTAG